MAELANDNPAPLTVEASFDDRDGPVITVVGDLDLSSVERLRAVVAPLLAERPAALTFDLAGLRFMDSAGIAVLLSAVSRLQEVRVRNPSLAVRRLLELTGLTDVLSIVP
jgi:anti-sigma B factor antagonist